MDKKELIEDINLRTGVTKTDIHKVINAFTAIIAEQLKLGNKVKINFLGVFLPIKKAARSITTPSSRGVVHVEERIVPMFKPSSSLRTWLRAKEEPNSSPNAQFKKIFGKVIPNYYRGDDCNN